MAAGGRALAQSSLGAPGQAPGRPLPAAPRAQARPGGAGPGVPLDDRVAEGLRREVLVRWGDGVTYDAPNWRPGIADAEAQARQFGWDAHLAAILPAPLAADGIPRAVAVFAHPTTRPALMFDLSDGGTGLRERIGAEIAAHGASVLDLVWRGDRWIVVEGGFRSRRITGASPCRLTGPAAGHAAMRTAADAEGVAPVGLLAVAAGCATPWGTVLLAEGNAPALFARAGHVDTSLWGPDPAPDAMRAWASLDDRFDPARAPNEPNRFGWIAELDPNEPELAPAKRSALGRGAHGGVLAAASPDRRAVVYLAERRPGGFLYRFVSSAHIDALDRATNATLLDTGTLSVARIAGGRVVWTPLALPAEAEEAGRMLVERTRRALGAGATGLDRPAGLALCPQTGRVYLALAGGAGGAAAPGDAGRIVALVPPGAGSGRGASGGGSGGGAGAGADHAADAMEMAEILRAGTGLAGAEGAALAAPDALACDADGRLWIASRGAPTMEAASGGRGPARPAVAAALFVMDQPGSGAGLRRIYGAPRDAAMGGIGFMPGGQVAVAAVRHPGAGAGANYGGPSTRWPNFDPPEPPRTTVITLARLGGGAPGR
ncbi:MAG: DUF839 domain-containing protein [Alphaproteobacteria bacterium]|nr:DUF839 domain-containing protein [Alphaproteobacteria bacterium]